MTGVFDFPRPLVSEMSVFFCVVEKSELMVLLFNRNMSGFLFIPKIANEKRSVVMTILLAFSIFSRNSEADVSEILENIEEM